MCTGQCAVVAVSSKCWRSMLALDMSAPAYTIDEANIACVGAGGLLVEARRRNAGECREASEVVGERRWSMSVRRGGGRLFQVSVTTVDYRPSLRWGFRLSESEPIPVRSVLLPFLEKFGPMCTKFKYNGQNGQNNAACKWWGQASLVRQRRIACAQATRGIHSCGQYRPIGRIRIAEDHS